MSAVIGYFCKDFPSRTLSKALDISSATAQVVLDLLKALSILSDTTTKRSTVDWEDLTPYWKSKKKSHFLTRLISLLASSHLIVLWARSTVIFAKIKKNNIDFIYTKKEINSCQDVVAFTLPLGKSNLIFCCTDSQEKFKKKEFWKNEKYCWRYHHFTCVPKIIIIWCTVPEIQSETDRIFCHFQSFLAFLPP